MSLPPLVPLNDPSEAGWKRKVANLLNAVARRSVDQGASDQRPVNPDIGTQFYDTSLTKPVWWDGGAWRDATGTAA